MTALDALVDKFCSHFSLGLPDVLFTEEKLAVEVGQVDGVHINHMEISEPH